MLFRYLGLCTWVCIHDAYAHPLALSKLNSYTGSKPQLYPYPLLEPFDLETAYVLLCACFTNVSHRMYNLVISLLNNPVDILGAQWT